MTTTPKRVSVSEITAWKDCRKKWDYRYQHAIAKPNNGALLASGSAVHGTLEALMRGEIDASMVPAKAETILREHFDGRHDLDDKVKRYLPGALRALSRFPAWVYDEPWQVEVPVEYKDRDDIIWGIPDTHRIEDDAIIIGEFKSTSNTSKTPLDYLLFNPQHRYYAVMLRQQYPDRPIYVRYAVAQTGLRGSVQEAEWLMKDRILDDAEADMVAAAREIGTLPIVPSYGVGCNYCDFKELCTNRITGSRHDESYMMSQLYVPKELTRE